MNTFTADPDSEDEIWEEDWATSPFPRVTTASEVDYKKVQPNFCWLPVGIIKRTFEKTMQWAKMPASSHLFKRFKSPHPFANVYRRDEDVSSDTIFADTPAIDCGHVCAQIYYGCKSTVTDAYGMERKKHFIKSLQDNVRDRGAMRRLLVDSCRTECSKKVHDFLRLLVIQFWQSEPYHQHQNPSERRWQTVQRISNRILGFTGAPDDCWLLAVQYVSFVLNHCATPALDYQVPLQVLMGQVADISPMLAFAWYEPVYYMVDDSSFPSETVEKRGRFVGIAENVGHLMTFKILTDDTRTVIS